MNPFFAPIQEDILIYKNRLETNNLVIDKTNQMFIELVLNILDYLGRENPELLDERCDYNISTMGDEFLEVLKTNSTNEKAQGTLMMFFSRIAKEMEVKYNKIYNKDLEKLLSIMSHKGYKYPLYINVQKNFTLDRMIEIIKRRESLK